MNIMGPLHTAGSPLTIAVVAGTILLGSTLGLAPANAHQDQPNGNHDSETSLTAHILSADEAAAFNDAIARDNARFVELAASQGAHFTVSDDGLRLTAPEGISSDEVLRLLNLADAQGVTHVVIDGSFGSASADIVVSLES